MKKQTKEFNPKKYPNTFFPNYFEKSDLEYVLGKTITTEEFQKIVKSFHDNMADEILRMFCDYIQSWVRENNK